MSVPSPVTELEKDESRHPVSFTMGFVPAGSQEVFVHPYRPLPDPVFEKSPGVADGEHGGNETSTPKVRYPP